MYVYMAISLSLSILLYAYIYLFYISIYLSISPRRGDLVRAMCAMIIIIIRMITIQVWYPTQILLSQHIDTFCVYIYITNLDLPDLVRAMRVNQI